MKFWSSDEVPGSSSHVPERRLLAAVLQRAITDYLTGDGDLRESADIWLMDDEPSDAPLSFGFICEALDLDLLSLRNAIRLQGTESSTRHELAV